MAMQDNFTCFQFCTKSKCFKISSRIVFWFAFDRLVNKTSMKLSNQIWEDIPSCMPSLLLQLEFRVSTLDIIIFIFKAIKKNKQSSSIIHPIHSETNNRIVRVSCQRKVGCVCNACNVVHMHKNIVVKGAFKHT